MPEGSVTLSSNPMQCLNYEFGMLLGREDFIVEQGYHRGKVRLHNAWLHREGVAWGYAVDLNPETDEIVVRRGLAYSPAGHELLLTTDVCVNVPLWLEKHRSDPGFEIRTDEASPGVEIFDAYVTLAPSACLSRPVPSIAQTCGDASTSGGVAYSRVMEVIDIRLVPGLPPEPGPLPFHRLRVLFGIEQPHIDEATNAATASDQEVLDARDNVLAQPEADQPAALLAFLRRFAALDSLEEKPWSDAGTGESSLTPSPEDTPIILATISGIRVQTGANGSGADLLEGTVDVTVRPTLIPTRTIQELLAGPAQSAAATPEAQGPRVVPSSVNSPDAETITFAFDADVQQASVSGESVQVSVLGESGWRVLVVTPTYDAASHMVSAHLDSAVAAGELIRLTVRGTGSTPVIGTNGAPLAGSADTPAGSTHEGSDFVWMFRRTEA